MRTSVPFQFSVCYMTASGFPVIGIGASAGGIDAFHSFFDHMPPDCGMAFVMILHLPADRKSMLTEILSRWTSMKVVEGVDGMRIEPNCVYVPPPHAEVTLSDGRLGVQMPPADSDRMFRPIDRFFDSLGTALREKAVGIVLSGTGSDGALGLKAIKACGGLTIAQGSDGSAPQYPEMPAGAIATGAVDLIAPVQEMPGHLMRMRNAAKESPASSDASTTDALRLEICTLLREQLGHDFSGYRSQTFLRRVERRMQVVNAATLQDYVAELRKVPSEATLLFRDLLIRVTSFFRDEETFKVLEAKVIPHLFEGKKADATVRAWVPGCATGEEAYSLAILLREYMGDLNGAPKVQIFATDIDEGAVRGFREFEHLCCRGERSEWIAQLVAQHRQELVLRAICFPKGFFGALALGDVADDAGEERRSSGSLTSLTARSIGEGGAVLALADDLAADADDLRLAGAQVVVRCSRRAAPRYGSGMSILTFWPITSAAA